MEAGAFFQGRSLKFQRPPAPVAAITGEVIDISAAESTPAQATHPRDCEARRA